MDWKYKHFYHEAVFKTSPESVHEAAREVVGESLKGLADTSDGFVARGFGALHIETATFRITPTPDGTKVAIELLVERAAMRGYMLVDIGGYYSGQVDKWFAGIAQRLGSGGEPVLVSKTTPNPNVRIGCGIGCLVYFMAAVCLVILAIPFDRALFPQSSASTPGPVSMVAATFGVLIGLTVFIYMVRYPDNPALKFINKLF